MKRLLFISFVCVILFSVIVSAKCGDDFCDPDEDCNNCYFDCLCEGFKCCVDPDCMECETSHCYGTCSSERTYWVLENIRCNEKGVISFRLGIKPFSTFMWNRIRLLNTYVYLKTNDTEDSFSEVKGNWYWKGEEIPKKNFYSLINKKIMFESEEGVVDMNGAYILRVKSRLGFKTNILVEKNVKCLTIKEEEPEIEEKETIPEQGKKVIIEEPEEKKGIFKRIVNYILAQIFS